MSRMPAIFIGHGSPMNAITDNPYARAWRHLGEALPRPKAVLAISAHFYTRGTFVTAMAAPKTIHDFGGFPDELFAVQYPAPGSPALAQRVAALLDPMTVELDRDAWGLDHGTWSILAHMYPEADIPVVQLSMDAGCPPQHHYDTGRRLSVLRDEGVLILASGNIVHNLARLQWDTPNEGADWAVRFDALVADAIVSRDHAALVEYGHWGSDARMSVPTPEHYLPLLYVVATQSEDDVVEFPVLGCSLGGLSMRSVCLRANPDGR